MALKYYHAEPLANSLKSMIPLKEKGLDYESIYVDLHKFEQHSDWFTAINPEGQVPVLDHDGTIITHTTVINEYLEDAFPDANPADGPLRPRDPVAAARMRYWNKFVDEHVMNHVSMHGVIPKGDNIKLKMPNKADSQIFLFISTTLNGSYEEFLILSGFWKRKTKDTSLS